MVAACWSPATPRMGIARAEDRRLGRAVVGGAVPDLGKDGARARRKMRRSSSSHAPSWMLKSSVREALVASVAWTLPPVRRQIRKESIVPKASSPRSAFSRAPFTWSRSQAILVAEKYGSRSRPVRAVTSGSMPALRSAAQASAVRRSCQTMARWIGFPVFRFQTTIVSRWLVMPMAAMAAALTLAFRARPWQVATTLSQISSGSCSTQPGFGKCWRNSFCASADDAHLRVEDDRARRGRALVDGEDVGGHRAAVTPSGRRRRHRRSRCRAAPQRRVR